MVMTPTSRRVFAILSACGFTASVLTYIASFSATLENTIFQWWISLFLGLLVLIIPIFIREYSSSKSSLFFLKDFPQIMPGWFIPCLVILLLNLIGHIAWFVVRGGLGVPSIEGGQYVLVDHGNILRVLTQAEYVFLNQAEARMFAAAMIVLYFVPMTYWAFRQTNSELSR